ncbi:MAG: hypothetical protein NVS1B11_01920 [Terriglobales bacterium]
MGSAAPAMLSAIRILIVPAAVREKQLTLVRETLVNPRTHGGGKNWIVRSEREILHYSARRGLGNQFQNILSY